MPESVQHMQLVERIVRYIARVHGPSGDVIVFHDLPGPLGCEKPPRISGFVPDVYATNMPHSITLLGEAKTEDDLETYHSRQQIKAYLAFLSQCHHGKFILAVPWQLAATAWNLVKASHTHGTRMPEVVILDGVRD